MLTVNIQDRGSGKTSRTIEMMREDKDLYCIVPTHATYRYYPSDLRSRMFIGEKFINDSRGLRINRVVLDEGFMYEKNQIARLYYELGLRNIDVVSFGTLNDQLDFKQLTY